MIAERLTREQRCRATRRTYKYGWYNFNNFLINLDCRPESWDEKLALFTAYLIQNANPGPTIKSYVSAVKAILQEDGAHIEDNSVTLTSLLKPTKYTAQPSRSVCQSNGAW